ncbi:OmpH family outer membrane protein [Chitinilyticum piscinae]|uniref:OmpH family outer membrane protein n=1 Tax=Chitinilyticum piscinae TaxID=2866724 RepID=A0A8J7G0Z6_9NEIS|nr:OmpH family outer membrane protein [Chitinilyticum piscinae]MBE9609398.1 OmpH family outer membrane protein [Chitinilyticum piscinae]
MIRSVFALILFTGLAGYAAADTKIGFVDTERVLREAVPAVRAAKKLEKEFEARRNELQRVSAQGKALQNAIDKGGISEAERRNKERDLIKLNQDFQRMQREYNEDLNARRNEELAGLQERANAVIRQIAEAERYDVILQDAVYRNPKLDITDKIIRQLADK